MNRLSRAAALTALLALPFACAAQRAAEPLVLARSAPAVGAWDEAFAAFADADRATPPPAGGVLFVGSSSIRLWQDLEQQFKAQPVVLKRGFGGSRLADCVQNVGRLVIRYRPATVLVYAGDNDLAMGSTPEEVAHRFAAFVDAVHRDLPDTQIDYISIKPSPSRATLLPAIAAANAMIRAYVAEHARLAYVDVYSAMLDEHGAPRAELFQPDQLHLNPSGYALWHKIIAPYVQVAGR